MVSHIILNVCAKSTVESMANGIVTVANLGGILIELNHILHDLVSIAHLEMFKGILGISDSIKGTKVGSEFIEEGDIGVLPCRQILQIWAEDVWFKPVKGSAGEKGNGIVDFTGIHRKKQWVCHKWVPATPTKIRAPSDLDHGPKYGSFMDAPTAGQRKKIHGNFCRNILLKDHNFTCIHLRQIIF